MVMERGWKSVEIPPNCPRCGSSNTKFCYYNNYSLTQPRYFCKGCRRYWTKGGSLRNIPVGGGCRKNRRVKSIKLPTGGVPSTHQTIGHSSYGNNKVNSSDACHIDLELVYANFLKNNDNSNNKQPQNKSDFEVAELPSHEFSPSLINTNLESSAELPVPAEENGAIGCLTRSGLPTENHLSNSDEICFPGLEYSFDHQDKVQQCTSVETSNYGLPPFPGDDISFQDVLWPLSSPSKSIVW